MRSCPCGTTEDRSGSHSRYSASAFFHWLRSFRRFCLSSGAKMMPCFSSSSVPKISPQLATADPDLQTAPRTTACGERECSSNPPDEERDSRFNSSHEERGFHSSDAERLSSSSPSVC